MATEGEPSHGDGGAREPPRHQERKTEAPRPEPGETLPVTPVTAGKRLPVCNAPPSSAQHRTGSRRRAHLHSPGAASLTARSHGRRGPRSPTSGGRRAASRGWCGAGRRRQRARPVSWGQTDRHRECRDGRGGDGPPGTAGAGPVKPPCVNSGKGRRPPSGRPEECGGKTGGASAGAARPQQAGPRTARDTDAAH